ncbi:hypothetical protein OGAPHI_000679 [Ogataea philodendri]|uniref:Uncharacterized protein n=1 Tax=Ogataea philodendri TaxID=1378263 RepID=A0A9P8T947_9ASCO|nr:uncharacterized protein OGAPHI_000679 [Ogataea philodendri]KAH3670968.1 hypothetical protein OGAPHI_000679 [Ogataea philodendri]
MAQLFEFDDENLASKTESLALNEPYVPEPLVVEDVPIGGGVESRLAKSYEVPIDLPYQAGKRKKNVTDFQPIRVLGKGSYGKVILVKDKVSGRLYAQKQLKKASMVVNAKNYERTLTERTILERVKHPNVVKLFYALQDFDKLYLMLEYLEGGELFHHLSQERILSEKVASFYVAEIILALRHLHLHTGVIYRDLKPENCMLNRRGHLVLTDFGLSKVSTESSSLFGTAQYIAPEVIQGERYDTQCDWWSLGAVLFDLLTGSPPFTGNNNKKIMDKILTQKVKYPFYLSQDAKDLLIKLLNKKPDKRLNCDTNFNDKVKPHRFFRYINWQHIIDQNDVEQPPPIIPVVTNSELAENFDSEFTSMKITPPSSPIAHSVLEKIEDESRSNSTSSFIAIKKPTADNKYEESVYFNGFSYTHEDNLMELKG